MKLFVWFFMLIPNVLSADSSKHLHRLFVDIYSLFCIHGET